MGAGSSERDLLCRLYACHKKLHAHLACACLRLIKIFAARASRQVL
jgi:hypothetical protein